MLLYSSPSHLNQGQGPSERGGISRPCLMKVRHVSFSSRLIMKHVMVHVGDLWWPPLEKEYRLFSDLSFDWLDLTNGLADQYQTVLSDRKERDSQFCWQSMIGELRWTVAEGFKNTCMGRVMMPRLEENGTAELNEHCFERKGETFNQANFCVCSFARFQDAHRPPRSSLKLRPC